MMMLLITMISIYKSNHPDVLLPLVVGDEIVPISTNRLDEGVKICEGST